MPQAILDDQTTLREAAVIPTMAGRRLARVSGVHIHQRMPEACHQEPQNIVPFGGQYVVLKPLDGITESSTAHSAGFRTRARKRHVGRPLAET